MNFNGIGPNKLGMSKSSPAKMMASPAKADPPSEDVVALNKRTGTGVGRLSSNESGVSNAYSAGNDRASRDIGNMKPMHLRNHSTIMAGERMLQEKGIGTQDMSPDAIKKALRTYNMFQDAQMEGNENYRAELGRREKEAGTI